jgi:hypothetical protein
LHEKTPLQAATLKVKFRTPANLKLRLDKQQAKITSSPLFFDRLLLSQARNESISDVLQPKRWRITVGTIPSLQVAANGCGDAPAVRSLLESPLRFHHEQRCNFILFRTLKTQVDRLDHARLCLTNLINEQTSKVQQINHGLCPKSGHSW